MNPPKTSQRNIAILVTGGTLSYLGDLLYLMALNIWISRVTNNPEQLGLITAIGSFALFAGNPIGGILADKYSKRLLLVATDLLSALAVIITYFFYEKNQIAFWPVICCNMILSFCFAIYSPTSRAIAPFITSGEGLRKLNSLLSITGEVTKIAAPAIGGFFLVLNQVGESSLILANSLSFLVSAGLNWFLIVEPRDVVTDNSGFLLDDLKGLIKGYEAVWYKIKNIQIILVPISLANFFASGVHVLLPFLDPTKEKILYPKLLLAEASGAVFGGFLSARLTTDLSWKHSQALLILAGFCLTGLHTFFSGAIHFLLLFTFGATLATFNVNFFTVAQKNTEEQYVGRTFGLIFTIISALVPLGNLFFSKLEIWTPGYGIVLAGAGMMISVAFFMLFFRKVDY